MDEYKLVRKYFEGKESKEKKPNYFVSIFSSFLLSALLLLISLCVIKINPSFKTWINKNVYQTNFSFSKINSTYEKYFGKIFPITSLGADTKPVFNESIVYKSKESYKEGVMLSVDSNYLVPVLESGIVVFMGNKDNYGKTIIIQQVNGIDLWYVGVENANIKLYDYVERGSLLGEAISNEIYLYYQKNGEFLDYKEYLS